ncbi:AI-2E family transporter [Candidatus Curtissbacteria bacterium]|nr:AI-2E family transporter [Candidatus Curtissbacteria bacterium]
MGEEKQPLRVEISYKTVIFTVAFLIGLWLTVTIRQILVLVFLSIILLSALRKPVEWLNSKRIPRVLSVLIVYIFVIAAISFAVGIIVPPLVSQTTDFISGLPQIIGTINDFLLFNKIPAEDLSRVIAGQLESIAGNFIAISTAIFSSIFLVVTIFVLTFYLLLEWKSFVRLIASPFSPKQEKKIINLAAKVENGLGQWLRGQLTLSIAVGVLTYIGLRILDIPYALPLALIAGIFEIIPIVGPIIAAIPAVLVSLTIAPVMGLATAALFFIIQQLENNLIVPMVMSKVIGLQPPVVIIALLIGAKLAGIGGAFLVVPIIVVGKIVIKEFLAEDQKLDDSLSEQ